MHSIKKISALAMALLMAVTMFVVPASAEDVNVKGSVKIGTLNISDNTADFSFTIPDGLTDVTGIELSLELPEGIAVEDVSSDLASINNGWGINVDNGKVLITAGNDGLDFTNKTVEKLLTAENGVYKLGKIHFDIADTVALGDYTAKITVLDIATGTGKTPHTNSEADTFEISLPKINVKDATVSVSAQTYSGSALKPSVTVKLGNVTLKNGTDYTVAYKNNTNKGTATVTVTGIGNYTGTKTATFAINAQSISKATVSGLSTKTYTGSAIKPTVTVKLGSKTLKNGTDYTVAYKNNTNAGTATVTITGKGNYSSTVVKTFKINAKKVTPTVSGYKTKTYNGKAQTQKLTVKVGKTTLKSSQYTVKYSSNKWVGKATVKVTLKGNYSGSKTVYFNINPKGTTVKSVSGGKKQLTVKLNKQGTQTSGYQIQYSTSKSFKGAKTVTVSSNKTTSKTIKSLKAKTKYYVRVRTYKTVGKTKYYSAWSSAKYATTKK